MAAGQERQEPEIFTQEVQEDKGAAGRHIHTVRIKSSIDPEKAWLYDLNTDINSLTLEQKEEYIAHQKEAIKRLPEALERMRDSIKSIVDIQQESMKTAPLILADALDDMTKTLFESFKDLYSTDVLEYTKEVLRRLSEDAQEAIQALKDDTEEKPKDNPQQARNKAIEKGAIMTIENRVASLSSKELADALTGHAIFLLPDSAKEFMFDDLGKLNSLSLKNNKLLPAEKTYTAILMAVLKMVLQSQNQTGDYCITFYVNSICRELKIDPRKFSTKRKDDSEYDKKTMREKRLATLVSIISLFDRAVAKLPDGSFYRVLSFSSYDAESDTMTINAPYLFKIKEMEEAKMTNTLFHGSITQEPNWAAVELANRILTGLKQRGLRPDPKTEKDLERENNGESPIKKVTYKVKYSTLIKDCPMLEEELQKIENESTKNKSQKKNKKLKDVFGAAYRIIKEKSDAFSYYKNLTFSAINSKTHAITTPTQSQLNGNLIITHEGKSG